MDGDKGLESNIQPSINRWRRTSRRTNGEKGPADNIQPKQEIDTKHQQERMVRGFRVLGLRFRAFAGFMYATSKQIETNGQEACNDG
jgi:hypothetical protein